MCMSLKRTRSISSHRRHIPCDSRQNWSHERQQQTLKMQQSSSSQPPRRCMLVPSGDWAMDSRYFFDSGVGIMWICGTPGFESVSVDVCGLFWEVLRSETGAESSGLSTVEGGVRVCPVVRNRLEGLIKAQDKGSICALSGRRGSSSWSANNDRSEEGGLAFGWYRLLSAGLIAPRTSDMSAEYTVPGRG